jgi:hypothetical protein
MNKKYIAIIALLIILSFIAYIIYDTAVQRSEPAAQQDTVRAPVYTENWNVIKTLLSDEGKLTSVFAGKDGSIYTGGESFVSCYDSQLVKKWTLKMPERITALTFGRDSLFAASSGKIYVISKGGKQIGEWGPYEVNSIFTSISANRRLVAVADAANKVVFMLRPDGEVLGLIGQRDKRFVIPSLFFDIALTAGDTIYITNPGWHRIEKWETHGFPISEFGKAGSAPDEFTACCNPSHFTLIPGGFITAEKGLNRIKVLDRDGKFTEFVSVNNKFVPSLPLDVSSADGKTIYAANRADSKLYIFRHK